MNQPLRISATRLALERTDAVEIGGVRFRPVDANTEGWILERAQDDGLAEFFSHETLARMNAAGEITHRRGAFDPDALRRSLGGGTDPVALMHEDLRDRVRLRAAFCEAMLQLEREGRVRRTDASITARMKELEELAAVYLKDSAPLAEQKGRAGRTREVPDGPDPSTLRRWLARFERGGMAALADRWSKSGNRTGHFTDEERAILMREARGYASPNRPTKTTITENVRKAILEENRRRAARGLSPLRTPSREAVRTAIGQLDPFEVSIARNGLEATRRKMTPVGTGLEVTRPLERVEIDEWEIDLITLMSSIGLMDLLDEDDRARLGLDGSKQRWWLSVAMCAATRCILAMRLSPVAGRTASAVETVHMMLCDKGPWADAVGAASPWSMAGLPETVVTDSGPGYKAFAFREALADLGIAYEATVAGVPQLRGRVERVFKTMAIKLLPRLSGRTFSNVVMRGDHDSEGRAALTLDDLTEAIVRWTVDIYHNSPHRGLGGQTPIARWQELAETWGVRPSPDKRTRRIVFGSKLQRVAGPAGLRVLGVWYQSEALQRWLIHTPDTERTVELRWYPDDIGTIEVKLDGAWTPVPAKMGGLDGVHARSWLAAARQLQAANRAGEALSEQIVLDAIAAIERIDADARARAAIVVDDWSPERLAQEEDKLFIGFHVAGPEPAAPAEATTPGEGITLPTAGAVADPAASSEATGGETGGGPGFTVED